MYSLQEIAKRQNALYDKKQKTIEQFNSIQWQDELFAKYLYQKIHTFYDDGFFPLEIEREVAEWWHNKEKKE